MLHRGECRELGSIWLWGTWALLAPRIILDLGESPPHHRPPPTPKGKPFAQRLWTTKKGTHPASYLVTMLTASLSLFLFMGYTSVVSFSVKVFPMGCNGPKIRWTNVCWMDRWILSMGSIPLGQLSMVYVMELSIITESSESFRW